MDALSISIVGGAGGALVLAIARYFAKRHYLMLAVSADASRSRANVREIREYIGEFFATSITEGMKIEISARYERSDTAIVNTLIAQLAHYAPEMLRRVIAFQEQVRKVEVLFSNFVTEVTLRKESGSVLAREDVNYLIAKAARVVAAADLLLATDSQELRDLPTQYPEVVPPVNMQHAILRIYNGEQVPRRMAVFVAGASSARLPLREPEKRTTPIACHTAGMNPDQLDKAPLPDKPGSGDEQVP